MTSMIARLMMAAGAGWLASMPAAAATIQCASHDVVTSMLADHYQEQREAIGLSRDGLVMEVFVSPSGTWTILLTSPNGLSCLMAEGEGYEEIAPPAPEA
jgi:hypothetical protein